MNEQDWIRRAAAGDPEAFEQLMLKYQKPIYNLTLRMTGNPDDAFDLTQEAFIRAWKAIDSVRADGAFSSWLYRLASNVCIDHLRAMKRKKTVSLVFEEDGEEQTMDVPDPSPSPEELVLLKADRECVERAMNELAVEQRQVLTLRLINGLSYEQISEILDVPEGTVKSRISRAREALRKKIQQSGNISVVPSSKQKERGKWHGL